MAWPGLFAAVLLLPRLASASCGLFGSCHHSSTSQTYSTPQLTMPTYNGGTFNQQPAATSSLALVTNAAVPDATGAPATSFGDPNAGLLTAAPTAGHAATDGTGVSGSLDNGGRRADAAFGGGSAMIGSQGGVSAESMPVVPGAPQAAVTANYGGAPINSGETYQAASMLRVPSLAAARGAVSGMTASADILSHEAAAKLRAGDVQGAVEAADRDIQSGSNASQAFSVRAEAKNRLKDYQGAYDDAMKALARDPNDARALKNLAWAALKLKKYDEALRAADRAVALNPNDALSYALRAYAKDVLGDRKGALADLETAALLDRRFSEKLAAAKEGAKIYDPDDDSTLGDVIASSPSPNARLRGLGLGAGLAGLAVLFVGAGMLFMRRRMAAQQALTLATLAPANPATPAFSANGRRMLGKYELARVMGRGGMGEVYEALDTSLSRPVAIKRLSTGLADKDSALRELLLKEAKTVAALHHPAIVDIYEVLQADELYLVFEFLTGRTLHQTLAEGGRLPVARALEVLKPICDALDFAHSRGLVHRDLKPANVMITELGHVKLMDFGIARSLSDAVAAAPATVAAATVSAPASVSAAAASRDDQLRYAQTRTIAGTGPYMGPESSAGVVCKEGDVYSAGVTLYEMLTGRLPFRSEAGGVDKMKLQFVPASTLAPGLPPAVDAVIAKALQPNPEHRYRSAREFFAAAEAASKTPAA